MKQELILYRVTLPYACFGLLTRSDGVIVNGAPMGKWSFGKHINSVKRYANRKRGTVEQIRRQ